VSERPRRNRRLFAALFANLIVFGAGVTLIGATVPTVIRQLEWSYVIAGTVLSVGSIGYFSSTFLCSVLVRRLGARKVIVGGLLVQAAGFVLFGARPGVLFNLAAMALIGLGEGGAEIVTNFAVVRMERPGQSRLMNLMHAAFTLGAMSGPVAVGFLLDWGLHWRTLYQALALLCAGMAALFFRLPFAGAEGRERRRSSSRRALLGLVRQPLLVLLALVIFLYVGAEIGVSNWMAEYYVGVFGFSEASGAYMVSVFWGGLLIGRLLLSLVYRGVKQAHLLCGLTLLAALALVGALLVGGPLAAGILFLLSGVGFSAIYPVVMALVGEYFAAEQSLAIGFVSTAGGIGSFSFPFVMSALAERYGMERGFWFYAALSLLMVGAAVAALWHQRRRPAAQS
jgi:fucose permease